MSRKACHNTHTLNPCLHRQFLHFEIYPYLNATEHDVSKKASFRNRSDSCSLKRSTSAILSLGFCIENAADKCQIISTVVGVTTLTIEAPQLKCNRNCSPGLKFLYLISQWKVGYWEGGNTRSPSICPTYLPILRSLLMQLHCHFDKFNSL